MMTKNNRTNLLLVAVVIITITLIATIFTACGSKEDNTESISLSSDAVSKTEEDFSSAISTTYETSNPFSTKYNFTTEEVEAVAKVLYCECRGVKSEAEKAAVVWCICNRVDSEDNYFPDTIMEVITQKNAFCFTEDVPVYPELEELAEDVLIRWNNEKAGQRNIGRTIPKDYIFFVGNEDHTHNLFTKEWHGTDYWEWSLASPYED